MPKYYFNEPEDEFDLYYKSYLDATEFDQAVEDSSNGMFNPNKGLNNQTDI